jgi:hypothetical protein
VINISGILGNTDEAGIAVQAVFSKIATRVLPQLLQDFSDIIRNAEQTEYCNFLRYL